MILVKKLSIFQIKIFALLTMTVGHAETMGLLPLGSVGALIIHIFGKMAAPLFMFALVEGLRHTRDIKKYVLRLYLAWVVTGILNMTVTEASGYMGRFGNIFGSYFFVAWFAMCAGIFQKRRGLGIAAALGAVGLSLPALLWSGTGWGSILNLFIPSLLAAEYSLAFVLMGAIWYFCGSKAVRCVVLVFFALVSASLPPNLLFSNEIQLMLPAAIVILFYSGEKGRSAKYLFYFYYPLHQYLFFALSLI